MRDPQDDAVPDTLIPKGTLPPLRFRDMPEPVHWRRMVGPSILLAGLALGSGEFVLWPHIVYKTGFVFFWACMLGVTTQFFLNMEIERWTLATGESAVTGFTRLSRHWAWILLVLNLLPWAWPGWATGAGTIASWIAFGPQEVVEHGVTRYAARHASWFGIAGLWLVGIVLTAGPVVYQTVEKIQVFLVSLILLMIAGLAILVIRGDAILAMTEGIVHVGRMPDLETSGITFMALLGALAFAGAGGTTNLGQSNFIREKGYAMGRYIGRITSPATGQAEPIPDTGFHFPHTEGNLARFRRWWRAANTEHFFSFFLTCVLALALMSLLSYSLFYDAEGALKPGMERFGQGMNFIWGEATVLAELGGAVKLAFLLTGVAILLTTELGVLDTVSRIAADLVKVGFLRDRAWCTPSRLYFFFLWAEILLGTVILLIPGLDEPLPLLHTSAAMNGGVMFLYSLLLLYMNARVLPRALAIGPVRFVAIVWSCAFFGYFSLQAVQREVLPWLFGAG